MMRDQDANRTVLIEGLIVNGLGQCKPVREIAAEIDRVLQAPDVPTGPDLRLAS